MLNNLHPQQIQSWVSLSLFVCVCACVHALLYVCLCVYVCICVCRNMLSRVEGSAHHSLSPYLNPVICCLILSYLAMLSYLIILTNAVLFYHTYQCCLIILTNVVLLYHTYQWCLIILTRGVNLSWQRRSDSYLDTWARYDTRKDACW